MTREDKTRRQHPARAIRGAVQRYLYENVPQPIGTMTRNNRSGGKLKVKGAGIAEEWSQRTYLHHVRQSKVDCASRGKHYGTSANLIIRTNTLQNIKKIQQQQQFIQTCHEGQNRRTSTKFFKITEAIFMFINRITFIIEGSAYSMLHTTTINITKTDDISESSKLCNIQSTNYKPFRECATVPQFAPGQRQQYSHHFWDLFNTNQIQKEGDN